MADALIGASLLAVPLISRGNVIGVISMRRNAGKSAFTPEDEQLLLGLIIRTVMENPEISRERLKGQSFEEDFKLHILMSARLDEGTLARFWGSLNQPVRPAIQAWTAIPILPDAAHSWTASTLTHIAVSEANSLAIAEYFPASGSWRSIFALAR